MATTITNIDTGAKVTPLDARGYESARAARTIIHEVLGTGKIDVTVRPAPTRSGTLALVFTSEATAAAAEAMLTSAATFRLAEPLLPTIGMTFVVTGNVSRSQDETRTVWFVDVPFREFL